MLRCNSTHTSVPGHVADKDSLVVHEVLSHTLVGPVVDEILEFDIIWPVIRVGNQNWHLDVINQVSILFDLCETVVTGKLVFVSVATRSSQSDWHLPGG